jgi:hypothetical protein
MIIAMPKVRSSAPPRRGRPSVHHESWSKVSVVLFDRQVLRLDRLVTDIRKHSGAALNRTVIIRALIDGLLDSKCDLRTSRTESDLRRCIADSLRRGTKAGSPN